jgi:hypothetical protein
MQRGKRINEKSSHPLSHNHLHLHTSDPQLFKIYQDAIDFQIKTLTQCTQIFSHPFDPQISAKVPQLEKIKWSNLPVSAESHFACYALINVGPVKLCKSLEDIGLSKMEPFITACHARSSTSSFLTSAT